MELILHITSRIRWEEAQRAGVYRADSLDTQGFIHFSLPRQVVRVANFLYKGEQNLVLLCVDSGRATAAIKYEEAVPGGDRFPHLYGPLNLDAVVRVVDFPTQPDGTFQLPPTLF